MQPEDPGSPGAELALSKPGFLKSGNNVYSTKTCINIMHFHLAGLCLTIVLTMTYSASVLPIKIPFGT